MMQRSEAQHAHGLCCTLLLFASTQFSWESHQKQSMEQQKEIVSDCPSSNSVWCSVSCALIEQLRPFPLCHSDSIGDLWSLPALHFESGDPFATVHPWGAPHSKIEAVDKLLRYCDFTWDDRGTKIEFHIQVEPLLIISPSCLIVTSTNCEMAASTSTFQGTTLYSTVSWNRSFDYSACSLVPTTVSQWCWYSV